MGSSEDMAHRNRKTLGQMLFPGDPVAASVYDKAPVSDPSTFRDVGRLDDVLWNLWQLLGLIVLGCVPGVLALWVFLMLTDPVVHVSCADSLSGLPCMP